MKFKEKTMLTGIGFVSLSLTVLTFFSTFAPIATAKETGDKNGGKAAITSTTIEEVQGLVAKGEKTSIKLRWGKIANIDGYRIYRRISGSGPPIWLTDIDPRRISYRDKEVTESMTYVYQIAAFRGSEVGSFSRQAKAAPRGKKSKLTSTDTIRVDYENRR